jgi:ABC-type transporter MlaC component
VADRERLPWGRFTGHVHDMMRWTLLTAWLVGLVSAAAAELRPSSREVSAAVVAVIEAQLAALREGDVGKAYTYASGPLRRQTPLPVFARMLQQTYPEIWRNQRATFALVYDDGDRATVAVRVVAARSAAAFDYTLVREREQWRVYSVLRRLVQPKGEL